MEPLNRYYDGVHPRAVQFVRHHARQLARSAPVPGMDVEDYEQDLVADLIARSKSFDPGRATYPTFADRVIRHRASRLKSRAPSRSAEAQAVPLDDEGVLEFACDHDDATSLRFDLERFLHALPVRLRRCCTWLVSENRLEASAALGLHRSTLYDAARDLRLRAIEAGLNAYLGHDDDPTHPRPAG